MNTAPDISLNFSFLVENYPREAKYVIRAERYVFFDANTSLLKSRQFAEFLAKSVAARNGFDPTGLSFEASVNLLRRHGIVDRHLRDRFEEVRTRGNKAMHEGIGNRNDALVALMASYDLAVWLQRATIAPDFNPGPFRPPPDPKDPEDDLHIELDLLRDELARYQTELKVAQGDVVDLEQVKRELEEECRNAFEQLEEALGTVARSRQRQADEQQEFELQLSELKSEVSALATEDAQDLISKARHAADKIGLYGSYADHVPLRQIRIFSQEKSRCCDEDEILVRFDINEEEGVVRLCSECRVEFQTLNNAQFEDLNIWVDCPRCNTRMDSKRVRIKFDGRIKNPYGFRCNICKWRCTLSSLLPDYTEL